MSRFRMAAPIWADPRWPPPRWLPPYVLIQDGRSHMSWFKMAAPIWADPKMAAPIWIFSRWRFPYGGFKMTVCSMMMSHSLWHHQDMCSNAPLAPEPSLVNKQYGSLCRRTDGAHWRKVEKYINHRLTCTQINLLDGPIEYLEQRVRHAQTRGQRSFRLSSRPWLVCEKCWARKPQSNWLTCTNCKINCGRWLDWLSLNYLCSTSLQYVTEHWR